MSVEMGGTGIWILGRTYAGSLDNLPLTVVGAPSVIVLSNGTLGSAEYTYEVSAGETYFSAVELEETVVNSRNTGTFIWLQLFLQDPLSDAFATRTPLRGSEFSVTTNNFGFTGETGEPLHTTNAPVTGTTTQSGWATWRTTQRRQVTVTIESSTFENLFAIYTGDELASLKRVAQADSTLGRAAGRQVYTSTTSFLAEENVDYHIAIDGARGRSGAFTITLDSEAIKPGFVVRPKSTLVTQGDPAVFTALAATTGAPTYRWQRRAAGSRSWQTLADGPIFSGTATPTLSLASTTISMNRDLFRVIASDQVGSETSPAARLTVTEFPPVTEEFLGSDIETNISTGEVPAPSNNGVYFATGLPRGLSIDPETGIISGTVTARPGTYRVTYGSTDGTKRNPEQFILQIVVTPFSPLLSGNFEGLLNDPLNSDPVGKLFVKVSSNARFTGKYFELASGKSYAFRGDLALNQDNRSAAPSAEEPVTISRGRNLPPLGLTFTLAEPASEQINGFTTLSATVSDAEDLILGQGSDGAAVSRVSAENPVEWAGTYTFALPDPTALGEIEGLDIPLGSGFATSKINSKTGALPLRGRLPDNTRLTANLAGSPGATYRLAQRVHAPGGSIAGRIHLNRLITDDALGFKYNITEADNARLFWVKPARPRDRLYPAGFGARPLALGLLAEPWREPNGSIPASLGLGSSATVPNLKINIVAAVPQDSNDALTTLANNYGLPIDVILQANGRLTYVSPATNDTNFSLTINASNGLYSGDYRLVDEVEGARDVVRKVRFSGALLQRSSAFLGDVIGSGFAIVPPFDENEPTTSALIDFRAGEPDSDFGITPDTGP